MDNSEIKINQIWHSPMDGPGFRRIRILAPNPGGGWIFEELPSRTHDEIHAYGLSRIEEINIRKLFQLEQDVCDHRRTSKREHVKYAIDDEPSKWICETCGDEFPLIGDTNMWFPKLLEAQNVNPNN